MTEPVKETKPKPIKVNVREIQPQDIVDSWRLYDASLKLAPPAYPSMDEEQPEAIRANLFNMIASPNFIGFMARHGRKPVAQITATIGQRPFGSPRTFLLVGLFWVDPAYRKQNVGDQILKELFIKAKQMGVHHFESWSDVALSDTFTRFLKGKGTVVSHRISGKITLE